MFIFPIPLPAPRASAHTICCCELGLLALLLLLCFISFAQKKISGRSAPPASPASTNYHETVFRKKFHRHRRRKKKTFQPSKLENFPAPARFIESRQTEKLCQFLFRLLYDPVIEVPPEKTSKGWRRCEKILRVGFIKTNLRFISPPSS